MRETIANRLYLDSACTPYTTDMACAINNYRIIRKEKKTPKEFTGDDETAWRASSNKHIFISGRYEFYCLPLIMIVYLMAMTSNGDIYLVYMNHSLVCADLISTYFGRKINDITIDLSYVTATFFGIYLNANVWRTIIHRVKYKIKPYIQMLPFVKSVVNTKLIRLLTKYIPIIFRITSSTISIFIHFSI